MTFPNLPRPTFDRNDVERILGVHDARGYRVFIDPDDNSFRLQLDDDFSIRISSTPGHSQVTLCHLGNRTNYYFQSVKSADELEKALVALANRVSGMDWLSSPQTARLKKVTPFSNLKLISDLIGTTTIECIFDPYLDLTGLAAITSLLAFGKAQADQRIRLLGCKSNGLPKQGVAAWFAELGVNGEVRLTQGQHRRFLLLGNKKALIIGCSLNKLAHDEAARLESDQNDRPFFDSLWTSATSLL
jgi:hypothetical protein